MKIAIIANQGGSGGLMAYLNGFLSVETCHEIMVYCTNDLNIGEMPKNINICRTEFAREKGIDVLCDKKLPNELIQLINNFQPDVVLFACGWTRRGLENYPNIMILHNQLYLDNHAFWNTVDAKSVFQFLGFRKAVRLSMKRADGVVFLSENSKLEADKRRIQYVRGKVIYFGLPKSDFNYNNMIRNVDHINLLYISSFYKYKNHETLIKAVKRLVDKGYDIRMSFVGEGPRSRENKLKKMANKAGLDNCISFLGWQPHDVAMTMMDKCDVFVYPSEVESTGLGVMEAMARGKVIACSNVSCMKEILSNAGLYFSPNDDNEAAKVIEKLICDLELRKILSDRAQRYSKKYTWDNAVNKYFDFFSEVKK